MKKVFHLIGELNVHNVDLLMEHLLAYEEIEDLEYNDKFHDLEIISDYAEVEHILEDCIGQLKLNIKFIERKAQKNVKYEKRYFTFTNFKYEENKVFLENYLNNDPNVESASFDKIQNILTVTTNDPFIYNKIAYLVEGFDEGIEVEEYFTNEHVLNRDFILRLVLIAVFALAAALVIVTQKETNIFTDIGWIIMFSILIYYPILGSYEDILKKQYFTYNQVTVVVAIGMFLSNHYGNACLMLFISNWINSLYNEVRVRFVNRTIDTMDAMVSTVLLHKDDGYVDCPVDSIQKGDVVVYHAGETIHFDGIVLEGEGMLDTCFMTGKDEIEEITMHHLVHSGNVLVSGGIEVQVDEVYHQSALYRLYHFNPKELYQHGYLEEKSMRRDLIYALVNTVLGLLIIIFGFFASAGRSHYIFSGLVFIYLCYPFILMRLRPLFYQIIKVIGIKNQVVFLNEDSLNRFIINNKDKKEVIIEDDDMIKYHQGGFNVQSIVSDSTIIYRNKEGLNVCADASNAVIDLWESNRWIIYITKFLLALLYLISIFPFYFILIVNMIINFAIIYRVNKTLNKLI